jgi:hypothetical protein
MRSINSNGRIALPGINSSVALVPSVHNGEKHRALPRQIQEIDVPSTMVIGAGEVARAIRKSTTLLLLMLWSLLLGTVSSFSQVACKPLVSIKSVREVRAPSPPALPWKWNATLLADTSFCATRSGNFEMDFVRIKEYSPDLQFTHKFRWSENEFDVLMELSPDEAILEFRIGFIAPCVCREINQLSSESHLK